MSCVIFSESIDSYSFQLIRGDVFTDSIIWKPGGVAADITNYNATMLLREHPNGPPVFEISTNNGRITLPAPLTGEFQLLVEADDSEDIPEGQFYYAFRILPPDPQQAKTILQGTFTVFPSLIDTG